MIFHIDDRIAELAQQVPPPSYLAMFLEELFRARRLGRHIIYCRPTTLEVLERTPELSTRTIQTIRKTREWQRFKKKLFESVSTYISIVPDEDTFVKVQKDGRQVIEISAKKLIDGDFLDEVNLLVENLTDAELYRAITDIVNLSLDQSQIIKNNFFAVNGGGSQTPRVYKELKKSKKLSFCIVDGDVEFLYGTLGGNTAKPISIAETQYPAVHTDSLILNCYSIENLIPPTWIRSATNQEHVSPPWFETLERYHSQEFWPFLTLKRGKKCGDFHGDFAGAVYWSRYIDVFSPIPKECSHRGEKTCNSKCLILQKMPDDTLITVVNYIEKIREANGIQELLPIMSALPSSVKLLWESIAKNLTSWSCAGEKMGAL